MKKLMVTTILLIAIMFYNSNVYAKDTVYTINKYKEENLEKILKSYTNAKEDGYLVAGTFLNDVIEVEEEKYNDEQVLLIKYDKKGNIVWKYIYGEESDDKLIDITYSYDNSSKVNGYTLIAYKTYNLSDEEKDSRPLFLIISERGKLVNEIDTTLDKETNILKIVETKNNDKTDGYMLIGSKKKEEKEVGFIAKYNLSHEKVWEKEYSDEKANTKITDIIEQEKKYLIIEETTFEEETNHKLIRLDEEGTITKIVKEDYEIKDEPTIIKNEGSYIVYGKTYEVKLKKDKSESFYLTKYNNKDEVVWETIGNTPINPEKELELQIVNNEYLLLYVNGEDESIELIKIDKDGTIKNKIKKIQNEYYNINKFLYNNDTIYFVGQIKCPEDEKCDYVANSLYLVSDKDKVIEVKDNDSKVIISTFLVLIFIITLYILRQSRMKKEVDAK